MPDGFRIEARDGATFVILARPEKHNAFDDRLISGLTTALTQLEADASVDLVVLAAEGSSFSAGADLDWMKEAAQTNYRGNLDDALALAKLMRTLDSLSRPTLALVQGPTYGGGVGLVSCCDIAIASTSARFALSEVRLGLTPATISPYVIRAIGPRNARRYFQTAEVFDAAEAARIGLVHETVEPDRLEARGLEIIKSLRAAAPQARRAAKKLVADFAGREIDDTLTFTTAERIASVRSGKEAKEGLSAFFERRKPSWPRPGEAQ